ncbi:MAG: aminodeoxychorismate synthase component I [Candidatus Omnitrophica bacterium]|nr:aminodeoxychorismate synthase component I [Candidatus Omnitrophota bacterium]
MAYYILKSYKLKVGPFQVFEALKNERNCFFLDSSLNSNYLGRYSFLGIDPFLAIETKEKYPYKQLREILNRYRFFDSKLRFPFVGGAIGYLAYDLGPVLEKKIKRKSKPGLDIPDSFFGFYNSTVIIDHFKQLLYIFTLGFPEKNYRLAKILSESNFKKINKLLSKIGPAQNYEKIDNSKSDTLRLDSNFTKEEYLSAIKKAKEYIKQGDIYQVNLSQTFQANNSSSGFDIYRRLRKISPSHFSAYLDGGDFQILSSSPESFLRLEGDKVTTRPMKGTRGRSKNRLEDLRFRKELIKSQKDKAELLMIVDLERNDLGRVCSYDSIKVSALRQVEQYNTVFQTTATVEGRLHKNKDRIDLLRACFPGGSITGCPKIRSMEIIEELEPTRRSIYTGSLGYLSFSGSMDFNILIRTVLKKQDMLYFGAGGGIVADSKPEEEYSETLVKAKAMIQAVS